MDTKKMRACAPLLPEPGDKVVCECLDEIERLREECREAWKEAAIGWTVCASVHEQWAKGKDALYTTRHGDFERHAEDARQRHTLLTPNAQAERPSGATGETR